MEIISEKLKHFIIKETGLKKANITMETSLEKDLNIYGEEALDFIQHFSECFKVNISGFKIDEYFSSEGDIISKFFKKMFIPSERKKDFLIKDLQKAIDKGLLE